MLALATRVNRSKMFICSAVVLRRGESDTTNAVVPVVVLVWTKVDPMVAGANAADETANRRSAAAVARRDMLMAD